MMPVEVFDFVGARFEQERMYKKEEWRRIRWLATHIINISGLSVKRPIKEEDLFKFDDEIEETKAKKLSPRKRRRQALKGARYHAKKFPGLIKGIYGEKDGKIS